MRSASGAWPSAASRAWRAATQRQLDQDEKARRADHVIRNDGTLEDLEGEVRRVAAEVAGEGAG